MQEVVYDYRQLKLGKYGLPTWDGLIPVVMAVAQQRERWKAADLCQTVADSIGLPDELRNFTYPNDSKNNVITDRANWTLSDLAISGLLRRPSRGTYVITPLGKTLHQQYGINLTVQIVHEQPAYQAHQRELAERKGQVVKASETDDGSIQETVAQIDMIRQEIEEFNAGIATALLERIREAEPVFFEHLMADLLTAMSYRGPDGEVIVTPPSHDGGIDGIINQDPLGTSTVYYQAKRYQADNVVQRPAIEGFYGALSRVHADRGVFISTSRFSKSAQETAKGFSIVLIDGIKLTSLMLHYHVGVQAKKTYELFQIDEDYFD